MEFSGVFWKNYDALAEGTRYISNRGGTRSGKTYSLLQLLYILIGMNDGAGDVTSVVSETMPHLKRGAIRDFEDILGHPLRNDDRWNATDCIFTFGSGARLEFFSVDSPSKVLGPRRKRLFVNECNHISFETFRQLDVRTTGLVFLDYNPAGLFWGIERIEEGGNCVTITSTYLDNPFLTPEQIVAIESNKKDANWWKVYGEGKVGSNDGLIFPDFEQIDVLPSPEGLADVFGQDYGFTHDPSTCVRCLIDTGRRIIYADELYYRRGMLNDDMAVEMERMGVPKHTKPIYGDCAEPKTIADLCRYGYNVLPCYKATRVAEQLQLLRGYDIKVTKRSVNLIRELRSLCWATDKDGNPLNEPQVGNDHAVDAARYAVVGFLTRSSTGQYRVR